MPREQFKAYFLALLADKEFTRIFDTISKVDKSFKRPAPYFRTQARGNQRVSPSNPRVTCYRCGTSPRPQVYTVLEAVSDDNPLFSFRRSRSQPASPDISVTGSTRSAILYEFWVLLKLNEHHYNVCFILYILTPPPPPPPPPQVKLFFISHFFISFLLMDMFKGVKILEIR